MVVVIADVRKLLDGLSSKQVGDDTLSENLSDALVLVTRFARTTADASEKDVATKRIAVWLSYLSYSEGMSFQRGSTPTFMTKKSDAYRNSAELYLNMVSEEPIDLEDIMRRDKDMMKAQAVDIIGHTPSSGVQ